MERWPNFFIIGAPRSGTTLLHNYLKQIPGIFMSSVKEPSYFAISINPKQKLTKPIHDKKKYLKLFEKAKYDDAVGESTPSYLWDPQAAKLIHQVVPDAKIIMILRNPVERAYSHYLQGIGFGYETLPLQEAMKKSLNSPNDYSNRITAAGFYSEQVKRYLNIFKKEQLKIFIFEEFIQDLEKSLGEILDFLGVHSEIPSSLKMVQNPVDISPGRFSKFLIRNKALRTIVRELVPYERSLEIRKIFSKKTEKPPLSDDDKKFLEDIYRQDVKKLQQILSRNLPWPVAKN